MADIKRGPFKVITCNCSIVPMHYVIVNSQGEKELGSWGYKSEQLDSKVEELNLLYAAAIMEGKA